MANFVYPLLSKAPITEAVIEIRSVQPVPPGAYEAFRAELSATYPTHNAIRFVSPHIHIENEHAVNARATMMQIGVRLESLDRRSVVQAKSDGITVSRLSPYDRWEELIGRTRQHWEVYRKVFAPMHVVRLGVRFINRIKLEFVNGQCDFDEMFTAPPHIPPALPQTLDSFATRVVVPMPEQNATAAIVLSFEGGGLGNDSVILDIDAYTETPFTPDTDGLWVQLDRLREAKNLAFFESLKEPIWRRYI